MSDSKGFGLGFIAMGCAPLLMFAGSLMFLVLMTSSSDRCIPTQVGGSVVIDVGSLPEGPIAGYHEEQLLNAAYVINAGAALGLNERDQSIGLMTAMAESSLRILDHGDEAGPDSRGLFQQRANGAWGSYEDRMDPTISATNFFKALMEVEDRDGMKRSLVAHEVQRNDDPWHYASYGDAADEIFSALAGIDMPGVPENYTAGSEVCANAPGGGGAPQLNGECGPVAHANLQASTCQGYAAISAEFNIDWPGGVGCYDPRPWEDPPLDHPKGLACDYMVATADTGKVPTPEMHAQSVQVINWLIQHHEALKIKYIIYDHHIWESDENEVGSWDSVKRFSESFNTGNLTLDHVDHIHVSHYL